MPLLARVRLAAATATWLRLVAEFDERGGWHGVGINSCGHWLAWQCGMSPVTAREHVRVADHVADAAVVTVVRRITFAFVDLKAEKEFLRVGERRRDDLVDVGLHGRVERRELLVA